MNTIHYFEADADNPLNPLVVGEAMFFSTRPLLVSSIELSYSNVGLIKVELENVYLDDVLLGKIRTTPVYTVVNHL